MRIEKRRNQIRQERDTHEEKNDIQTDSTAALTKELQTIEDEGQDRDEGRFGVEGNWEQATIIPLTEGIKTPLTLVSNTLSSSYNHSTSDGTTPFQQQLGVQGKSMIATDNWNHHSD